jgi:hypothetical protein
VTATDFDLINLVAGTSKFKIRGDGLTTVDGGVVVAAGGASFTGGLQVCLPVSQSLSVTVTVAVSLSLSLSLSLCHCLSVTVSLSLSVSVSF